MMECRRECYRLSILLVTYNHERYIEQALKSVVGQRVDGPVEIVVADDGSTDSTLRIIKEWEGRDSRFHFKYLDSKINCGITKNYQRGFAACQGEHVAVLEGDDYWTSPFKLQRQLEFLDQHWECDMCSVNYFVYEEMRGQFSPRTAIGNAYRLLGARDLIADNLVGNFSTCMYRKAALVALPAALFEAKSYDWIVNICIGRRGLIGFLEEPMSVYRLHNAGVWTQTPALEKLRQQLDVIPIYSQFTDHVFRDAFDALAGRLHQLIEESVAPANATGAVAPELQPLARSMPLVWAIGRVAIPRQIKPYVVKMLRRKGV